jgi:NAD(P)-dependent dehydrogenase (short-subunit alcohol dehydrogenase family)
MRSSVASSSGRTPALSLRDSTRMIDRRMFMAGLIASAASSAGAKTPLSKYGPQSTAEEVTEGLNLSGMTAVVTGCNAGIGLETMRVLALRGAHVIGTARTREKGAEACGKVKGRATPVVLELADFPSVGECADRIHDLTPRIDMLILNAGVVVGKLEKVYGLEKHFVVNHLGHFLLANRLLDLVRAAPQGRVVTVGSGNSRDAPPGGIQFDNLSGERWVGRGYPHSKLANALFSLELARLFGDKGPTSNCVTPGAVRTNILRHVPNASTAHQTKSPAQGAATQCYVATSPALAKVSGEYFRDCNPAAQSGHERDAAMAKRLWDVSTQLTATYLR